ncbi:YrdB family protein [Alpinimonas psychrophila]|uniref:Small-conductance mechanosensitive channel n=1 Tax=Alpinimonas psychrophila TaxID=748908 RepID=A0A7W3JVC4_9MICO|nr:YrdB family protein [Alpinimonas psychrophila]MBA8829976.1 small-conductance mechanosensitive channel [Alpinimonas psychrophila]
MSEMNVPTKVSALDVIRALVELFAVISLILWGLLGFAFPLPGLIIAILAPALAILLWALFRSPKAVFRVDYFVKALVEIVVMATAAFAWFDLQQPIIGVVFLVIAAVTGVIQGLREI